MSQLSQKPGKGTECKPGNQQLKYFLLKMFSETFFFSYSRNCKELLLTSLVGK